MQGGGGGGSADCTDDGERALGNTEGPFMTLEKWFNVMELLSIFPSAKRRFLDFIIFYAFPFTMR